MRIQFDVGLGDSGGGVELGDLLVEILAEGGDRGAHLVELTIAAEVEAELGVGVFAAQSDGGENDREQAHAHAAFVGL